MCDFLDQEKGAGPFFPISFCGFGVRALRTPVSSSPSDQIGVASDLSGGVVRQDIKEKNRTLNAATPDRQVMHAETNWSLNCSLRVSGC